MAGNVENNEYGFIYRVLGGEGSLGKALKKSREKKFFELMEAFGSIATPDVCPVCGYLHTKDAPCPKTSLVPGSSVREEFNKWLREVPIQQRVEDSEKLDLLETDERIVRRVVGEGRYLQINIPIIKEDETLREALERLLNDANDVKEEEDNE